MGEARRKRELGLERVGKAEAALVGKGAWRIRPLAVNFPLALYDRMERIRPGVHVGGRVLGTGDFVVFLVDRMLAVMMQAARAEAEAKEKAGRKDALVKTPAELAQEVMGGER